MATKLRNVKILRPIFRLRDNVMTKLHLFEAKKKIKHWLYFRRLQIEDFIRRQQMARKIRKLPTNILRPIEGQNIIVSMTSFGKRVKSSAAYALYSILLQQQLPNRIVLNLNREKWNNNNLPKLLKCLQRAGVEMNFCEDVGPHTKLLPTLQKYPDDIIITVDDDICYDDTLISELYTAYQSSDQRSVICRDGKYICKRNGKYIPYSQCVSLDAICYDEIVSTIPFGVGGVLYPPHIFSDEIYNKTVFRQLCRFADDVWFGIMELRDKVKIIYLPNNSYHKAIPVDRVLAYSWTNPGNLMFLNDTLGKNDEQFTSLLEYYNL